jgi:hypothetical protein
MKYAMYQSHALIPNDADENNAILSASVRNNAQVQVTGFLHREGDCFLQYLEGEDGALQQTMDRIWRDPRHESREMLDTGEIDNRMFPDWQMGFVAGQDLAIGDMLNLERDGWRFKVHDPFEMVVFLTTNADLLRAAA